MRRFLPQLSACAPLTYDSRIAPHTLNVAIIGAGRTAWAFGSSLREAGHRIAGICTRRGSAATAAALLGAPHLTLPEVPPSDLLLVATPDDELDAVSATVTRSLDPATVLLHASGSRTSEVFAPHPHRGSLHPLRALPPVGQKADLRDALLVFEGTVGAEVMARIVAESAAARLTSISPETKLRYHAAAVFASNYVAALLETSERLLESIGAHEVRQQDLTELAISAIDNWGRAEGAARFTGPVARGDLTLIRDQLQELAADSETASLYRALAATLARHLLRHDAQRDDLQRLRDILGGPVIS